MSSTSVLGGGGGVVVVSNSAPALTVIHSPYVGGGRLGDEGLAPFFPPFLPFFTPSFFHPPLSPFTPSSFLPSPGGGRFEDYSHAEKKTKMGKGKW
jgi:hypothetical protein